jgi:acyl-CoA dehydrogenase
VSTAVELSRSGGPASIYEARPALPDEIRSTLTALDAFIDSELVPLEQTNDNIRFFDHRRESARTDFANQGLPSAEWAEVIAEMRRRADAAGWLRWTLPEDVGGHNASQLETVAIREHLALRGVGLHNPLEQEISVVANNPSAILLHTFGTSEQKDELIEDVAACRRSLAFGLTEPHFGSDATRLATTARRFGSDWVINGKKRWISFLDDPNAVVMVFARTSGEPGTVEGITAFLVPMDTPGFEGTNFWWTMNMPTDHAEFSLRDVRVPGTSMIGEEGKGLELVQRFVHRNRMRQASASVGAAQYCVNAAVAYANEREVWNRKLSVNQAVQFPLVELHSEITALRYLLRDTAQLLDEHNHDEVGHFVSMCNYRANRTACEAADRAIQFCGALGYSRHMPFELIYRVHRRYRITEGAEEIQMRRVAKQLFGFGGRR